MVGTLVGYQDPGRLGFMHHTVVSPLLFLATLYQFRQFMHALD
jgi:hypothetical protein